MRAFLLTFAILLVAQSASALSTFPATVKDQETGEPVAGATLPVEGAEISA